MRGARGGEKKSVIRHLSGGKGAARGVGKLISASRNGLLKVTAAVAVRHRAQRLFALFPNKREEFALTALSCYNGEKLTRK